MPVKVVEKITDTEHQFFVINTKVQDFRGVCTELTFEVNQEHALISQQAAHALGLSDGDNIRFAPTHFRT
jgi:arginine N-succinyltransferase